MQFIFVFVCFPKQKSKENSWPSVGVDEAPAVWLSNG